MIIQALLNMVVQRAWQLIISNLPLAFFGFTGPVYLFSIQPPNLYDEIRFAISTDLAALVAALSFDFAGFMSAALQPLKAKPHFFVLGRIGMAFIVYGAGLLAMSNALLLGLRLAQVDWRGALHSLLRRFRRRTGYLRPVPDPESTRKQMAG